jgi:hypothetical protein
MAEWIPLFQTLVWPIFVIALVVYFRTTWSTILGAIAERIRSGASIKAGPGGIELGAITAVVKQEVNKLEQDVVDLLISTVLDAYEYVTLQKIRGDRPNDSFKFTTKGHAQLERLVNVGLIEEKKGSNLFADGNERWIWVRDHYSLTDRGTQYLEEVQKLGVAEKLRNIAEGHFDERPESERGR